ncbi:hypothetical protein [Hartmannibacter diazotrophicus]|nr:hypothetical protein [Hartmannibacter diazotrophicus]
MVIVWALPHVCADIADIADPVESDVANRIAHMARCFRLIQPRPLLCLSSPFQKKSSNMAGGGDDCPSALKIDRKASASSQAACNRPRSVKARIHQRCRQKIMACRAYADPKVVQATDQATRQPMSDIGGIFTPADILLMILVACSPGALVGAVLGAILRPGRRLIAALLGAVAGFVAAFVGWFVYLEVFK